MPRPQHVSIADMSPGDIELAAQYFQMASSATPLSLQEFVDRLNRDTDSNISKPTASRALAKIQKRSDVKIFDETEGGALRISQERGVDDFIQGFCLAARQLAASYAQLEALGASATVLPSLRIGMYPSLIRYLGPPLVKELNRRCKQLRIEFEHGATIALIDQICAGSVDYAIGVAGESHPRLDSPSNREINEVSLPLQWSTMGLTFLYKDGKSTAFRKLWELLTRPKVSLEELTSVLLDHPLCAVDQPRNKHLHEAASYFLSELFSQSMRVDSVATRQLTIVKTYRQARILARAGVAVAAGPEPVRKDSAASRRVRLPGAFVGYDPGHEDAPLAFIPARRLRPPKQTSTMISGRPYAAYYLQDFEARFTEAKAAAMHELHKIVMRLCEGKIRGAEGLRYRVIKTGGRVLMDNLID